MRAALYFVVIQASLFALGAAGVATVLMIHRKPPKWWAYALTKGSILVTIGLLTQLVYGISGRELPLTWRTVVYAIGMVGMCVGLVGISFDVITRTTKRAVHEDHHVDERTS